MALTTAANVRALSEGQAIPSSEDTLLGVLITRAGAAMARWCGYPPASPGAAPTLESASYTRYTGESGCYVRHSDRRDLLLEPWPVTAVSAIYEDTEEVWGAATEVDSSQWERTGPDGATIRLKSTSTHGLWDSAPRRIKVAFTAGFSSVPADLEQAAIELVLHWWGLRQRRGLTAVVAPDGLNTAFRDETIPAHVAQTLGAYRLPSTVL